MKTETYLSIDLDWWESSRIAHADLQRLMSVVRKRNIPVAAVMNHNQLLPYVSKSSARRLVNIDQHSDLQGADTNTFSCGSWVSYVTWRKEGEYIWFRKNRNIELGECNGSDPIFRGGSKINKKLTDWRRVSTTRSARFPHVNEVLKGVVEVGLCLSPFYIPDTYPEGEFERVFRHIVQQFEIPYKRGRRNEHVWEQERRPPS